MAFTQTDVDALKAAMAKGVRRVRNSNGEEVLYNSFAEMRQALAMMEAEVAGSAAPRRATGFYPKYQRFPCDDPAG